LSIVVVPKYHRIGEGFSQVEKLKAQEHPGRQSNVKRSGYQSASSWICDLSDLRKGILLCSWCRKNFNPKRNKYRIKYTPDATGKTSGYVANGVCNSCKCRTEDTGGGVFLIAEEYWKQLSVDPGEARATWRAKMKARGVKSL